MTDDLPALRTSRPATVGLHKGAKSLIRNVIRHTDTHNRLLEESEMWQLYHRMKGANPNDKDVAVDKNRGATMERSRDGQGNSSEDRGTKLREPDIQHSFLYDDRKDMKWEGGSRRGMKRAHMDDSSDDDKRNNAASSKSTFWMRELHKAEETDPDRWGHAGYKELYPDAFDSDRSVARDDGGKHKLKKKKHSKKRHKHKSLTKKKKRKKTHHNDSVKKKKKKRKSDSGESSKEKKRSRREKSSDESVNDSSNDSSGTDRKAVEVKSRTEISESDNSEDESQKKRERRNIKTDSEREKRTAARETTTDKPHWSKKRRKH